jgi:hypothetical protein
MKKVILVATLILFSGLNCLLAQRVNMHPVSSRVLPIPSYNVKVKGKTTSFKELNNQDPILTREKRDMDVEISTSSTAPITVFATVWVVKANSLIINGPYIVYSDQTLSVPIDNEQWGVVINSDWEVFASVWID